MRKPYLTLLVLTGVLALSGPVVSAQKQKSNLHDRAKQSGGKLVEKFQAERSVIYPNLTELAKRSTAIVIGRALNHRAHLTTDGTFITTDVSVAVQEVVKGNLRRGSVVLVSLPGGGHRFEDGVTAFLYADNYRPAQNGKTYVFFLDKKGPVARGYELAGGIQGQFELSFESGKVIAGDTVPVDPIVPKYRNKPIKDFLVELHRVAK
jgi:hypothetical protein